MLYLSFSFIFSVSKQSCVFTVRLFLFFFSSLLINLVMRLCRKFFSENLLRFFFKKNPNCIGIHTPWSFVQTFVFLYKFIEFFIGQRKQRNCNVVVHRDLRQSSDSSLLALLLPRTCCCFLSLFRAFILSVRTDCFGFLSHDMLFFASPWQYCNHIVSFIWHIFLFLVVQLPHGCLLSSLHHMLLVWLYLKIAILRESVGMKSMWGRGKGRDWGFLIVVVWW